MEEESAQLRVTGTAAIIMNNYGNYGNITVMMGRQWWDRGEVRR